MTGGEWLAKGERDYLARLDAEMARERRPQPVRAPLAEVARIQPCSVAALRARAAFHALFAGKRVQ